MIVPFICSIFCYSDNHHDANLLLGDNQKQESSSKLRKEKENKVCRRRQQKQKTYQVLGFETLENCTKYPVSNPKEQKARLTVVLLYDYNGNNEAVTKVPETMCHVETFIHT
jgi:hypothetical protein